MAEPALLLPRGVETRYFLGDKFLPLFTADDLKEPLE